MKNLRTLLTIFFALSCFSQAISSQSLALADGNLEQSYKATGIAGELAPPDYGLRLDGFFDNKSQSEVIFQFNTVNLDLYDNGKLHMHGIVSIPHIDFKSRYILNVVFHEIVDENELSKIEHYNPDYKYYSRADVQENASLTNLEDASDTTQLWSHPPSESKPFRIGIGANEFNDNLGAFGSLRYKHYFDDKITGTGYKNTGEFRMNLTPIEDPPEAVVEIISTELIAPSALIPNYGLRVNTNQEFQIKSTLVNHSDINIENFKLYLSSNQSSIFDSPTIIENFGAGDTVEVFFDVTAGSEPTFEEFVTSLLPTEINNSTQTLLIIQIEEPATVNMYYQLWGVIEGKILTNSQFQLYTLLTESRLLYHNSHFKLEIGFVGEPRIVIQEGQMHFDLNVYDLTSPETEGLFRVTYTFQDTLLDPNTNEPPIIVGKLNFDETILVKEVITTGGGLFADANQSNSNLLKLGETSDMFDLYLENRVDSIVSDIQVYQMTVRFFDNFGRPIFLGDYIDGSTTGMYLGEELISTSRIDLNKMQLDFTNLVIAPESNNKITFKANFKDTLTEFVELTFVYSEIDAYYKDGPYLASKPNIIVKDDNEESFTYTFNDSDFGGEIIIKNNPVWHAIDPIVIAYDLKFVSSVDFRVYTLTGEEVYERRISAGNEGASVGENIIEWDGRNNSNDLVRSGVYIISIYSQASGDVMRTKVALIN